MAWASSPDVRQSFGSWDESPVRCPPLYDIATYIRDSVAYFDAKRFSKQTIIGARLVAPYGPRVRDVAVSALQNGWKH